MSFPNKSASKNKMIKEQLFNRGIKNEQVLNAMNVIDRIDFVPLSLKNFAYEDRPLEIGNKQTISQPYIVGSMTSLCEINSNSNVLEIGTGSGYQTAILSYLAKKVTTIELIPELSEKAKDIIKNNYPLLFKKIEFIISDGKEGYLNNFPYDAILVACAASVVPINLLKQLNINGKLIIPLQESNNTQILFRFTKVKEFDFENNLTSNIDESNIKSFIKEEKICEVRFVPML